MGTNDLKRLEPQVAGSVIDLARQIENSSDATATISELVSRRDIFNEAVKTTEVLLPAEWMEIYPASKHLRKGT